MTRRFEGLQEGLLVRPGRPGRRAHDRGYVLRPFLR